MSEDVQLPPSVFEHPVIEGYSVWWPVRIAGPLCFFVVNPLFVWIWIDKPRFVQGPIDFPEIFIGAISIAMIALGCCGLFMPFLKTRFTTAGIEWRSAFTKQLKWGDINYVERVGTHRYQFIPLVTVMRIRTSSGQRVEVPGGTNQFLKLFEAMEQHYPRPTATAARH